MAYVNYNALKQIGEIKQNFHWDIDFQGLFDLSFVNKLTVKQEIDKFTFMCESVDLPRKDINWVQTSLRGVDFKVAGKAEMSGELTFTFIDNVDNVTENIFHDWGNIIFNTFGGNFSSAITELEDTSKWGAALAPYQGDATNSSPDEYKCDLIIYRLNAAKKRIQKYTLFGCGYVSYDPGGTLSGNDSEMSRPSITISYDTWHVQFL